MSAALSTDALIQATGWALLHLVWQGTLVATLLAIARSLLSGRRDNLRYTLSCLALALVVVLGIVTGVRSYRVAASPRADTVLVTQPIGPSRVVLPPTQELPTRPERLQSLVHAANAALPRIVLIWLVGVALFSGRLVLEWLRVRQLLTRNAAEAPEPWPSVARRLSSKLGVRHVVRVLESAAVEVPSVIGLVRPAILLPGSSLTGLSPAQLEMILAHELAHIRRHDFLVNLLQAIVETLLFYHPAVWWISRQVRIERENCCDDLAVATCGNRIEYARALLQLEELRAEPQALALSASGGSLFERIHRLSRRPISTSGPAVRAVGALAIQLCVLLAIVGPSISAIRRSADERPGGAGTAPLSQVAEAAEPGSSDVSSDASPDDSEPSAEPGDVEDSDAKGAPHQDSVEEEAWDAEPGRPSLDELIMLRAQNVTPEDVEEMRSLFPRISLRDVANMAAVGASPGFVREMRRAGLEVRSAQDAQGLAALGVTPSYIREMRSAGFSVVTAQEAQGLKAVGVTAAFVRGMRSAGLRLSPEEAQGLAALGATPEYLEELRDAGVVIEKAQEVQSLRALGITPEFVRRLAKAGYPHLSVEDLSRLAAAGVTGDFIREMSRYRSR